MLEQAIPKTRIRVVAASGEATITLREPYAIIETTWTEHQPGDDQTTEVFVDGQCYLRSVMPIAASGVTEERLWLEGTSIDRYLLTGAWRVAVYRNGASEPSAEAD